MIAVKLQVQFLLFKKVIFCVNNYQKNEEMIVEVKQTINLVNYEENGQKG